MAVERWITGLLLAGIFGVSRVAKDEVAATVLDGTARQGKAPATGPTVPGRGQAEQELDDA